MKLSVVINTCALGPKAKEVTGSWSDTPHAVREYVLNNFIIPMYIQHPHIHELIIVGEWTEGEGYTYIHCPSEYFSCVDALEQRHQGALAATGDWIVFQHDDHIMDIAIPYVLKDITENAEDVPDIVVPSGRYRRHLGAYVDIPSGKEEGYIMGHCSIMRKTATEIAPWNEVYKVHAWDLAHTLLCGQEGLSMAWAEGMKVYDVEPGTGND